MEVPVYCCQVLSDPVSSVTVSQKYTSQLGPKSDQYYLSPNRNSITCSEMLITKNKRA